MNQATTMMTTTLGTTTMMNHVASSYSSGVLLNTDVVASMQDESRSMLQLPPISSLLLSPPSTHSVLPSSSAMTHASSRDFLVYGSTQHFPESRYSFNVAGFDSYVHYESRDSLLMMNPFRSPTTNKPFTAVTPSCPPNFSIKKSTDFTTTYRETKIPVCNHAQGPTTHYPYYQQAPPTSRKIPIHHTASSNRPFHSTTSLSNALVDEFSTASTCNGSDHSLLLESPNYQHGGTSNASSRSSVSSPQHSPRIHHQPSATNELAADLSPNEEEGRIIALAALAMVKKTTKRKSSSYPPENTDDSAGESSSEDTMEANYSKEKIGKLRLKSSTKGMSKNKNGLSKGWWTEEEHQRFLQGMEACGNNWKLIAEKYVKTRSRTQVASHGQKWKQSMGLIP